MSRAPAISSSVRMPSTGPRCWPCSSVIGVSQGRVTVNGTVCSASSASRNPPPTVKRSRTAVASSSSSWPSRSTLATRRRVIRSTVASVPPPRSRTSPERVPPGRAGPGCRTVSTEGPPTPRAPSNFLNTMCGVRSFCEWAIEGPGVLSGPDPPDAPRAASPGEISRKAKDFPARPLRTVPATRVTVRLPKPALPPRRAARAAHDAGTASRAGSGRHSV
ncbi:hypothetical protein SCALM49S_05581 [Streptomyces californicus]